jgi:hypothetical protein
MSETTYDAAARASWRDPAELAPAFVALAERVNPALSGQRFSAWEVATSGLPAVSSREMSPMTVCDDGS